MKGVQCYELFGGIALKNHTFSFSFFSRSFYVYITVLTFNLCYYRSLAAKIFHLMIILKKHYIFLENNLKTHNSQRILHL